MGLFWRVATMTVARGLAFSRTLTRSHCQDLSSRPSSQGLTSAGGYIMNGVQAKRYLVKGPSNALNRDLVGVNTWLLPKWQKP